MGVEADRERARLLLRNDFLVYPERALQIVNKAGVRVPFVLKRPQVRLARALHAQREAGQPMRAVILKSRQVGYSTQTQGMLIQRATQIPFHYALVVGQDTKTAGELFSIGRRMWQALPPDIQPQIAYERNSRGGQKFMQFGEPSILARRAGITGLDSSIEISTAKEVDAGRGLTIRSLHLSEVSFWKYPEKKDGLLNAVPDDPDTLVIIESTANGHNHYRDDWLAAEDGSSGYHPMFTPWFEEDGYCRPFISKTEQLRFVGSIGAHKYGDDERSLMELMRTEIPRLAVEAGMPMLRPELKGLEQRILEHLNWRRWAIPAKCGGKLDKFHQEYPSNPEEAFLSTGRKVFRPELVRPVLAYVETSDPRTPTAELPGPARGAFRPVTQKVVRAPRGISIEVPKSVEWVPALKLPADVVARWEVWEAPQKATVVDGRRVPEGQYVVACDPMSGEDSGGELANHAIQVVNHRTLGQAAQYESRDDPDQVALELLLVALHYHGAWIAVETTGGWGLSIVQRLARDYRYPRIYAREQPDRRMLKHHDRLGWSTDAATKPMLMDRATEVLRDEIPGVIRSRRLAGQLLTYIRDERGRTMPEAQKLADLLMAWAIAQKVAELRPLRPDRKAGHVSRTPYRRSRDLV